MHASFDARERPSCLDIGENGDSPQNKHGGRLDLALLSRRSTSRPAGPRPQLLHLDGRAVRQLPYAARRELLASLELKGPAWRTPRHFVGLAERLLTATAEQGLEGVVAKRLDAAYREGRSRAWVKHKHRRDRYRPTRSTGSLFITCHGQRLTNGAFGEAFRKLIAAVGLEGAGERDRPRPHDYADVGTTTICAMLLLSGR